MLQEPQPPHPAGITASMLPSMTPSRLVTGSGDGSATLRPRQSGHCRPRSEPLRSALRRGRETASGGECAGAWETYAVPCRLSARYKLYASTLT